jgi:hypothetical protein
VIEPQMPAEMIETQIASSPVGEPGVTLPLDTMESEIVPTAILNLEQTELLSVCIEDTVEITSPADGDRVSGSVEVIGSVNVDNFGSYKYEFSPTGNINWVTIAAGNQLKLDENIGFWYTSALTPGTYLLRLVPLDNAGMELTPCIVTIEVVREE